MVESTTLKLLIAVRTEFENTDEINIDDVRPTLLIHVLKLLQGWKQIGIIKGIYNHNDSLQVDEFQDTDQWIDPPKLIVKKKNIYAEVCVRLALNCATY